MAFTNLINIYSSNSDIDGVEQTFTQMRGANLKPDEHAFANVMKIYSKRRDYEKAESLIETMDTVGKEEGRLKKQFSTMLMQAYPAEMLAKSEEIFQGLEKPDWMAYEMMMKKYIEAKQYQKVYDLYEQLKTNRVKIEQRIYATILDACYYDGLVIKPDLVETIKKQLYQDAYQTPKNSFDMHRIKRYWREMREIYSYRKREPLVKRALTRILKTRKQHASDTNKQAYEARELGVRKEKARKEFEDRAREVEIEREQAKLQQQLAIQQAREKKKQRQ
jgi:pentatricopeptide repeat protein